MTNDEQAAIVGKINELFEACGVADRYRLDWDDELHNEAIVEGTVTDIDTRDEFVFAIRLRVNGTGVPFDIYAEKDARCQLRHTVRIGDYLKVKAYLKPASFDTGFCYLHVDDEEDILQHIHEG